MKSHWVFAAIFFAALVVAPLRAQDDMSYATMGHTTVQPLQIDVSKVLNARVVTTLTEGKVVPFDQGVDDYGGVATRQAAVAMKNASAPSVPDDGKFPAAGTHPEVTLHFSNDDGKNPQVRRSASGADDDYAFDVPARKYFLMQLFFTAGGGGPSVPVKVVLTYQDGTTTERDLMAPDWYRNLDPAKDKDWYLLGANLSKWGRTKVMEWNHHNIAGVELHPDFNKVLTRIAVHKSKGVVVFWGATGVPISL